MKISKKRIERLKKTKICVVGDLMLDHFIFGDTERISPEAPVPVVLVSQEFSTPGGAGNVAANIVSLGGNATMFGIVGNDNAGKELIKSFESMGVQTRGIVTENSIKTTEKIRIITRGQHVVRADKDHKVVLLPALERKIIKQIVDSLKDFDCIVLSDYAKGFLTKKMIKKIISVCKTNNIKVLGDPKPINARYFKNVYLLAPNLKEAQEIGGNTKNISKLGRKIQKKFSCNVLITQGFQGMTLFDDKEIHIETKAREVYDVSGAGDTVMAALALALGAGLSSAQASYLANVAAGIAVGKTGTSAVTFKELEKELHE